MAQKNEIQETARIDALFEKVSVLIEQARHYVATTVNLSEVYTKYHIGQYIVEDEQQGEYRAQYGKQVLKNLSVRLTDRFGSGWSVETLDKCRKFYRVYSSKQISSTAQTKSEFVNSVDEISQQRLLNSFSDTLVRKSAENISFTLSWSHYLRNLLLAYCFAKARKTLLLNLRCQRMQTFTLRNISSICQTRICYRQK